MDIQAQVIAKTIDKPRYPTLSDALRAGANVGIFGGLDPATGTGEFKEWRLTGDCIEFRPFGSEDKWCVVENVQDIFKHRFSLGLWGFHRQFSNFF